MPLQQRMEWYFTQCNCIWFSIYKVYEYCIYKLMKWHVNNYFLCNLFNMAYQLTSRECIKSSVTVCWLHTKMIREERWSYFEIKEIAQFAYYRYCELSYWYNRVTARLRRTYVTDIVPEFRIYLRVCIWIRVKLSQKMIDADKLFSCSVQYTIEPVTGRNRCLTYRGYYCKSI